MLSWVLKIKKKKKKKKKPLYSTPLWFKIADMFLMMIRLTKLYSCWLTNSLNRIYVSYNTADFYDASIWLDAKIGAQDMWAGGGDRKMKTEIQSESRTHREKETKTGYGRKLTTNSCPTRVSERRQWAELGMRNMKLWKSEERWGKGNGERYWLGNGTQGGMYYICTLWASGSKQSKKSNTCIWGEITKQDIFCNLSMMLILVPF